MAHITTEQALQIPQQLKKHGEQSAHHAAQKPESHDKTILLSDETVTLLRNRSNSNVKNLSVDNYKYELGQDTTIVKETLRNKLAEYNLNPNTAVMVGKDAFGQIELKGALLQSDIDRLSEDLNNHSVFKDSFDRLSQQQPTLNYVDNVVKISSAYGVENNLFNSLISDKTEFNNLNDIAHRYESLKTTTGKQVINKDMTLQIEGIEPFKFNLNA